MKITGEIIGTKIVANSDTTELISELLKNDEFKKFVDRSKSFEEIMFWLAKYRDEIIFLQGQNLEVLAKIENEKNRNKRWNRFFEFGLIFFTFVLILTKYL